MRTQRGGFVLGLLVGVLIGVAASLAVALYVTKVPVPFMNKVPQRTAEQDAAEVERNRHWDPNAPLGSKPVVKGQPAASAPPAAAPAPPAMAFPAPAPAPRPGASAPQTAPATAAKPVPPPAGLSTAPGADPFIYFVQAGAFARSDEAEQQRAKLAMLGHAAKVTEREQSGRTMYRVRLGPFDRKEAAEGAQQQLAVSGVEAALVRVQR